MPAFIKKSVCIFLSLMFALSAVAATVTFNLASAAEYEVTINAYDTTGDEHFSYYPADKWTRGPKINEYYSVDTTASGNENCYYTLNFTGTAIEVWGYKSTNHGIIKYTVDGANEQIIDSYAASRTSNAVKLCEFKNLDPNTEHTLKAEPAGKNASSASGAMQVSKVVVYKPVAVDAPELFATVVDSDDYYTQSSYNTVLAADVKSESLWTWKNDKAVAQLAVLSVGKALNGVKVEIGEFTSENGKTLDSSGFTAAFINEVNATPGNAGWYSDNPNAILSTGVREQYFDVIYSSDPIDMAADRLQLVWLDFNVPSDAAPGVYKGTVTVSAENSDVTQAIEYTVEVLDITFADTDSYAFRPIYWTYPFTTAEYYDVEPFSEEHMQILEKHLQTYKDYGGVTLTGTLVDEAWGGQTYGETDPANGDIVRCPSLIKWTKKTDGSWEFDYSYFDKYMTLLKSMGIGDDLVLYSPIPWGTGYNYQMTYFDEARGAYVQVNENLNDMNKYRSYWGAFFESFTLHLDEKGWFDDVSLGFDERPNMIGVFDVIDSYRNKDGHIFRKQGAVNSSVSEAAKRMEKCAYNLRVCIREDMANFRATLAERKNQGYVTTFYTGTAIFPNSFIRSLPAESYWTMMYSGALDLNGFLDWAYDAWVADPLVDATHSSFQAGDVFMVYPSAKNSGSTETKLSIRSEKYDEGVRDINKLYEMRAAFPDELGAEINALFASVKDNYTADNVPNDPSWDLRFGRNSQWITQSSRVQMLADVAEFKDSVYRISKKYADLLAASKPAVDTQALEDKLAQAEAIEQGSYSDESFSTLTSAIAAANALLADENKTQEQIDAQLEALTAAIEGLCCRLGDVNGDGSINAADAAMVLQRFAGIIDDSAENFNSAVANVNDDNEINAADAAMILQLFAGIISNF